MVTTGTHTEAFNSHIYSHEGVSSFLSQQAMVSRVRHIGWVWFALRNNKRDLIVTA